MDVSFLKEIFSPPSWPAERCPLPIPTEAPLGSPRPLSRIAASPAALPPPLPGAVLTACGSRPTRRAEPPRHRHRGRSARRGSGVICWEGRPNLLPGLQAHSKAAPQGHGFLAALHGGDRQLKSRSASFSLLTPKRTSSLPRAASPGLRFALSSRNSGTEPRRTTEAPSATKGRSLLHCKF